MTTSYRPSRRSVLLGTAAAGLGVAVPALTAAPAHAATGGRRQLAFLNHTYTALDTATAAAVVDNAYLHEFGAFQLRTTTNGQLTYSGRYLLGVHTYLEMFAEGDLPAPDGQRGASGLALTPDRAGLSDQIKDRLQRLGVAQPLDFVQDKVIDGASVPWFRTLAVSPDYTAAFPWVMEYLESYFEDPRTHSAPAAYPGDVSRRRYNTGNGAPGHLMRDVIGVEIGVPAGDLGSFVDIMTAAGLTVRTRDGAAIGVGASELIVLTTATASTQGWRRIVFALSSSVDKRHVETIGNSTLAVGPGPQAVWTFHQG